MQVDIDGMGVKTICREGGAGAKLQRRQTQRLDPNRIQKVSRGSRLRLSLAVDSLAGFGM